MRALMLLMLLALPVLSGCASQTGLLLRGTAVERAAGAYDESLTTAELWLCRGASIGSVVRAYGASPERWAAWLRLCGYAGGEAPARPALEL